MVHHFRRQLRCLCTWLKIVDTWEDHYTFGQTCCLRPVQANGHTGTYSPQMGFTLNDHMPIRGIVTDFVVFKNPSKLSLLAITCCLVNFANTLFQICFCTACLSLTSPRMLVPRRTGTLSWYLVFGITSIITDKSNVHVSTSNVYFHIPQVFVLPVYLSEVQEC